jgi:hypothetical protein
MKKFKKLFKYILHLISRCIYWIVPKEYRTVPQESSIDSLIKDNTTKENYEFFKEIFKSTILYRDIDSIRKYAIQNSLSNDKQKELFYLEFGVFKGESTNFFSNYVKKIYAFDSFEGLREDWLGSWGKGKGDFNLNKKIPKLNSNIEPIVGFVQDTLDNFLKKNNPKINFVHLDMDTYPSTKYALERLKPFLSEDAIIIFDEFYNYPGWENGEYKALKEVFKDEEYIYKAFNTFDRQAVIQIKIKSIS